MPSGLSLCCALHRRFILDLRLRSGLDRRIARTPLFGLALLSLSACTTPPDNAGAGRQSTLVTACSWLEGYPDCGRGHALAAPRDFYASTPVGAD
jgi:hypothetical protein